MAGRVEIPAMSKGQIAILRHPQLQQLVFIAKQREKKIQLRL